MSAASNIRRRQFIRSAATVTAAGATVGNAASKKPSGIPSSHKSTPIRVGMVGLGPYSHAMAYAKAINDPAFPPRTNMRVTAVWGRDDGYRQSFRGNDNWVRERMDTLAVSMSDQTFHDTLGILHRVREPEDMLPHVDAVFITDPEDALRLARPFLEAGKPVFVNRPFAWSIGEAREIIRLAKTNGCVLVGGSCIPWMNEFQVAASRIDPESVQHYYAEGSTANFVSYMPHILETAQKLTGGLVTSCATYGMDWPAEEDPLAIPPVMTHLVHESLDDARDPVVGVVSTWHGEPYRNWAKVHSDRDVVEQGVYWEGERSGFDPAEHLWLPFLRVIGRAFETGEWPEDEAYLLEKVRIMLMAHKSGTEDGRVVYRGEVEQHELPRYQTERA